MTASADQDNAQQGLAHHKSLRTRTGCLNCRQRKRKCDEQRPSCGGCRKKKHPCSWGLKLSFRHENAQHLAGNHPSMRRFSRHRPKQYEIVDVTSEVMRDYSLPPPSQRNGVHDEHGAHSSAGRVARENRLFTGYSGGVQQTEIPAPKEASRVDSCAAVGASSTDPETPPMNGIVSPVNRRQTEISVADLSDASQRGQSTEPTHQSVHVRLDPTSVRSVADCDDLDHNQPFAPSGTYFEDGVFLPGSAYHESHSILRQQLIQESRPNVSTRPATPSTKVSRQDNDLCQDCNHDKPLGSVPDNLTAISKTTQFIVSAEEECGLWRNWFANVAPWLDIFDMERHFQHTLPALAPSNDHLRCAILALSARQQELKRPANPTHRSLALYQEAVRLLLPELASRSTAAVASCVILSVLETLSCPPESWHRHLDGCASFMGAVGINGFVGGVNQALFWCLARTDVCGALLSALTLAVSTWSKANTDDDDDVRLYQPTNCTAWANYAVHLTARVLNLLSSQTTNRRDLTFRTRWLRLWKHLCDWQERRPPPFLPVMSMPSTATNTPFPTVIFSNPAATSATQLYHTASVLMLQHQPTEATLPKARTALWHARQICAVSISNEHHGAWMNAVQPLWVAGRCIRHPAEHKAILDVLQRIEEETGCETKSRQEDLRSFWRGVED